MADSTLPLLLVGAGALLSIAEAVIPGAHFIVLGVALLAAGVVGLVIGPLSGPLALAALTLLFGASAFYIYREFDFYGGSGTAQTSDSDSLKGQTARVTETVTPTDGEVKLESGGFNPYYAARSFEGEIPEGSEVMVVDPGGGNVLQVQLLDPIEDSIDRELARGRARLDAEGDAAEREATGGDAREAGNEGNDAEEDATPGVETERETEDR